MAIRRVRIDTDDILKKRSREVTDFNEKLVTLIDDMIETMDREQGVGLAAPQVGVLRRVVVVHEEDKEPVEYINPELLTFEGEQENAEACLSLPGRQGMVKRPAKVRVKAVNRRGEEFFTDADDTLAVVLCHEIDHLEGVLFTDKAIRMLTKEEMDALEREEQKKGRRAKFRRMRKL